ncbi:hypothetical protein DRN74_01570 [Candidatus Micrarchaeota archaeon]|nr:MAG: hypothetical protein DRN74_01570 [Candidatus Micrarchaeota archaeon]
MEEIDETDEKIIEILKKDSRTAYTDISKKLGLSDVAVKKRIDKLIEKGIIKHFSITLDYAKIGKPLRAFLLLRMKPSYTEDIIEHLAKIDGVLNVLQTVGSYDFLVELVCRDMGELKRIAEEQIGNLEGINEIRTLIGV